MVLFEASPRVGQRVHGAGEISDAEIVVLKDGIQRRRSAPDALRRRERRGVRRELEDAGVLVVHRLRVAHVAADEHARVAGARRADRQRVAARDRGEVALEREERRVTHVEKTLVPSNVQFVGLARVAHHDQLVGSGDIGQATNRECVCDRKLIPSCDHRRVGGRRFDVFFFRMIKNVVKKTFVQNVGMHRERDLRHPPSPRLDRQNPALAAPPGPPTFRDAS
mmetsp:Transcript_31666/g.104763  ORF Transcript_31666/g.104763 Transcript_31666/m.104763 type:complete len:223 (+) Transcript_31666:405-1073(+)